MRWLIVTPFIISRADRWLGAFVTGQRHSFESLPGRYLHDRSRRRTGAAGWLDFLAHAWSALGALPRSDAAAGIITCFPQLPTALGLLCRLRCRKLPIIAWAFNLGQLPTGFRLTLARFALSRVSLFVVHSRAEIETCCQWLGFDRSRFVFVPLQSPRREASLPEDVDSPYLLAMGTANRDYALLFDAVRELGVRTIVVAGPHAVAHLDKPPNLELRSGLTAEQCLELLQACRVSVIPVDNPHTASGQVTLLDSLALGKATVITDCPGSSDYIADGVTALAVPPGDRARLRDAIARLWNDPGLRDRLSVAARRDVRERFSDETIGKQLEAICDDVERRASASSR